MEVVVRALSVPIFRFLTLSAFVSILSVPYRRLKVLTNNDVSVCHGKITKNDHIFLQKFEAAKKNAAENQRRYQRLEWQFLIGIGE